MVEVRGICKSFGRVRAVADVSFDIPAGRVTGLLGPNGAGKTSTIRMVTGWVPPDRGSIRIFGHDMADQAREARSRLGYLPESAPSYGEMTTSDYLDLRARLFGLPRPRRRERTGFVIDRCRLGEVRSRRISHLSKGFRQRVAIAAALVHDPRVLVLDEPTNALDPTQIREIRALIRELAPERAILVSSHILAEVEATCDRVIVMARGRVLASGTPRELAGERCIVECQAGPDAALAMLRAVEGCAAEPAPPTSPGACRFVASPRADLPLAELRARIACAAMEARMPILELRDEHASLEAVFVRLIESAPARGEDEGAP